MMVYCVIQAWPAVVMAPIDLALEFASGGASAAASPSNAGSGPRRGRDSESGSEMGLKDSIWTMAGAVLVTTVWVDGLFGSQLCCSLASVA